MSAREGWFSGLSYPTLADETDQLIDRALADLSDLSNRIRDCFALAQSFMTAAHLRLADAQRRTAQAQSEQAEKFQRTLDVAIAVIGIPALVAAIYGANTQLPERDSWAGFALLLAAMLLGALATWAAIGRWRRRYRV
jgi:Mg2+ and Co2+ transporter CorA